ncbi:hypothetical protein HWX41_13095 [Bacillus paramycoides]|uniref:hypothetical protein n=1 Tax=Bacillus paramycoides TaxID=2026194 RepID=UPI0015B8C10B|nr:hypothetical protein [Bacillus paramycoides]NWK69979.1 hypothetical protein [Bacillus paramycoides]
MSSLYKDSRLYYILGANSLSAIGSGIVMITEFEKWMKVMVGGVRGYKVHHSRGTTYLYYG